MMTNLIHGRTRAGSDGTASLAIGETGANVFECPGCARPLEHGTRRCPGCGTRFMLGVAGRRAASILAIGALFGALVGGSATAAIITISGAGARPAAVVTPSAAPIATPGVVATLAPVEVGVPHAAVSALSGTAVVNGRITVDAETLTAALAKPGASSIEIARALRSLAADAALGIDLAGRLGPWTEATDVQADLDAFYRSMADTARSALRASFADPAAYRSSGAQMVTVLEMLGEVDAASRQLAASVDLELPPVVLPVATR